MAILLINGFETYETAADIQSDAALTYTGNPQIVVGGSPSRHGSRALYFSAAAHSVTFPFPQNTSTTLIFSATETHLTIGQVSHLFKDSADNTLLEFRDSATNISAYNGSGELLFSNSVTKVGNNQLISLKVTFDSTNGFIEVYIDGVFEGASPISSDTTHPSSPDDIPVKLELNNLVDTFRENYMDNIVIANDQGPDYNDILGDIGVLRISPTGDNSVQWTPDFGATNYTQVDNLQGVGEFNWVESGVIGEVDLYDYSNLAATGNPILAVQAKGRFYDLDPSPGSVKLLVNTGIYSNESSSLVATATSTSQNGELLTYQDNISVAWTEAAVNAIVAGVERAA